MNTSHADNVPASSWPRPAGSPRPLLRPAGQCHRRLLCWPGWALVQKHGPSAPGSCLAVRQPATGSLLNGAAAPRLALPGRRRGREAPGVARPSGCPQVFPVSSRKSTMGSGPAWLLHREALTLSRQLRGCAGPPPGGALTGQPTSRTRRWPLCPSLGHSPAKEPPAHGRLD